MVNSSDTSLSLSIHSSDSGSFEDDTPRTCADRSKKCVASKLPILQWLPEYKRSYILADLISGITVWLTAVPQSMAYAAIAGLTPEVNSIISGHDIRLP